MELFDTHQILRRHNKGSFGNSEKVTRRSGPSGAGEEFCVGPEGPANISEAIATCCKSDEASIVQSNEENRYPLIR
jgi:hypothetical protein